MFGFSFAPINYMPCNGQLLPIAQYEALYALLGTTYGGDGISTFALPDLRSRVPIHQGTGLGLSNYVLGQKAGVESVTLTTNQMPQHNHLIACSGAGGNQASPQSNFPAVESTGSSLDYHPNSSGAIMNSNMVTPFGGSQPHENLQPLLCINFCIAVQGVFPSQN